MKNSTFQFFQNWLKKEIGLNLAAGKEYLVSSSLMPVAQKFNFKNIDEMAKALEGRKSLRLINAVKEAMTVNESFFFRDKIPFDHLELDILPDLIEEKIKSRDLKLRIWCAACSSGQEPYSIAMILRKMRSKLDLFNCEIVATDLSLDMVEKAKIGVYNQFEAQRGMPVKMLIDNFDKQGMNWAVKSHLKKMIKFEQMNLLSSYFKLGAFDVIFARNVLIYFDKATKFDIVNRMARVLTPGGYLFLGGAETLNGGPDMFDPVYGKRGIFKLKENWCRHGLSNKTIKPQDIPNIINDIPVTVQTKHHDHRLAQINNSRQENEAWQEDEECAIKALNQATAALRGLQKKKA